MDLTDTREMKRVVCLGCKGEDIDTCRWCDEEGMVEIPALPLRWFLGVNMKFQGRTHLVVYHDNTFGTDSFCGLNSITCTKWFPPEDRPVVDCNECNAVADEVAVVDELGARLRLADFYTALKQQEQTT